MSALRHRPDKTCSVQSVVPHPTILSPPSVEVPPSGTFRKSSLCGNDGCRGGGLEPGILLPLERGLQLEALLSPVNILAAFSTARSGYPSLPGLI